MAVYCADGAIRWVMADDGVRQPPKVGEVGKCESRRKMPFMNNNYLLPNFLHFAMLLSAAALRGAYASVRVPPTRSGVN